MLDYTKIGRRIAGRRRSLGLTQAQVSELVEISVPYISNIERGVSIPSTEVVMRLALALDTTPDEFLVGTSRWEGDEWRNVAELLRGLDKEKLEAADGETIKKVLGSSGDLAKRIKAIASRVADNAKVNMETVSNQYNSAGGMANSYLSRFNIRG